MQSHPPLGTAGGARGRRRNAGGLDGARFACRHSWTDGADSASV